MTEVDHAGPSRTTTGVTYGSTGRAAALLAMALGWLSGWPGAASAGNDDELLVGDQAALAGGAVTAMAEGAGALAYNPAGVMRGTDENHIDASATVYGVRRYVTRALLSLPTQAADGESFLEITVVPSTLAYVRQLGRLRVGVGFFQRRATSLTLRANVSDDSAGQLDWRLTIVDRNQLYDAVVGTGFSPHPRLHLGFALHGLVSSTSGFIAFGGGLVDPVTRQADYALSQSFLVSATTVSARVSAGLQWSPTDDVSVGASIDSPARTLYSSTTVDFSAQQQSPTNNGFATDSVDRTGLVYERFQPARVRVGVALERPWGWLALDGDLQPAVHRSDLDRKLVWNLRVGGLFRVTDVLQVGAGLFTDRASEHRPDSFGEARVHAYGATLGLRFMKDRQLAPGEEAPRLRFESTFALRYAYGAGRVAGLDVAPVPDVNDPNVTSPRISPMRVHEVSLYMGSRLSF